MNFELGTRCTVKCDILSITLPDSVSLRRHMSTPPAMDEAFTTQLPDPRAATDRIEGPALQIRRLFTVVKDRTRGTMHSGAHIQSRI